MNKMLWLLIAVTCHADYNFNSMMQPAPAMARFADPNYFIPLKLLPRCRESLP